MNARIKMGNGVGRRTVIEIDGQNIADSVTGFTLDARARHKPTLLLDLFVGGPFEFGGEVRIAVPPKTHAALVAIGWTPPSEPA